MMTFKKLNKDHRLIVVLDIETTGVDFENNQILEFAAVIEDLDEEIPLEELPKFHCIFYHNNINASMFAMNMHAKNGLLTRIQEAYNKNRGKEIPGDYYYWGYDNFIKDFRNWLEHYKNDISITDSYKRLKFIPMGKNVISFDMKFLNNIEKFKQNFIYSHRGIDVGMLWFDKDKDIEAPSLDVIKERAKIEGEVSHNALEDVYDTIKVYRKGVKNISIK